MFGVFFCNLLINSFFNYFPSICTFRPKSACIDLKKELIQKFRTDHLKFSPNCPIDAQGGISKKKTGALCAAVLELFRILDRGGWGEFFVPSPVIGGLTWSDSSALAERAALLPCKPRLLALAMAAEDGILSVSKQTDGILRIIFPSM